MYYGEGYFDLSVLVMRGSTVHMPDVVKHLQQLQAALLTGGSLPALRPGEGKDCFLYITHLEGHPVIILPLLTATTAAD